MSPQRRDIGTRSASQNINLFVTRHTSAARVQRNNPVSADDGSDDLLRRAVDVMRDGGVVAHAAEGVWGLACDPFDGAAVDRVLAIKGRDAEKGLIVAAGRVEAFAIELEGLDDEVAARVRASWPGAVTWVVPNRRFPHWITGNRGTVAIRVPGHEQARALAERFGGAIVSTSANRSGVEPARTARAVVDALGEAVDFVLPGGIGSSAGPSRIIDASSGRTLR